MVKDETYSMVHSWLADLREAAKCSGNVERFLVFGHLRCNDWICDTICHLGGAILQMLVQEVP